MAETLDHSNAATPPAGAGGCVVFLVDETAVMEERVAEGTKSKLDSVATAINSLLNQLDAQSDLDLALVGFRGDADGSVDVACRWGGPLEGRTSVHSGQLADAPVTIEDRVRKIPGPGGVGVAREETVRFPIWYVPRSQCAASPAKAYEFCRELLSTRPAESKPPLVISCLGELGPDESLAAIVDGLMQLRFAGSPPLVFHSHLSSSAQVPPTLYPSANVHLTPGTEMQIFQCSSPLPEGMADALRQFQMVVNPGARGMIYNAKMVDLIRFFSLVKAYQQYQPPPVVEAAVAPAAAAEPVQPVEAPAEPEIPTGPFEPIAAVVLVLDRTLDDPADENQQKAYRRLQEQANELLAAISARGRGTIEVAAVSFGAGENGQPEVQKTFAGPLAERTFVPDGDLAENSLRVDEFSEQVSNGIGGLIEVKRKRPIFVDLGPTASAAAGPAFAAVAELLVDWCRQHPTSPVPPIVLHLTRGRVDPAELEQAAAGLSEIPDAGRGAALYHLVITDSPHRSMAYPAQPEGIEDPALLKIWQLSSPLLGSRRLAAEKPAVAADSRAIVINGKFDLLLDGVLDIVGSDPSGPRNVAE